jgi:hypothetical protein
VSAELLTDVVHMINESLNDGGIPYRWSWSLLFLFFLIVVVSVSHNVRKLHHVLTTPFWSFFEELILCFCDSCCFIRSSG